MSFKSNIKISYDPKKNSDFSSLNEREHDINHIFLHTKFLIPMTRGIVIERKILYTKLEGILQNKLAIVNCPAGFGKTTALSTWAFMKKQDNVIAWISLDERDNNVHDFWSAVIYSLDNAYPNAFKKCIYMLKAPSIYPLENVLNILTYIINSLSVKVIIILDDFHNISDVETNETLHLILSTFSHNLHLILITREKPAIDITSFQLNNELLEINIDDLRFNITEIRELACCLTNQILPIEIFRSLEKATEGWAVAVKIAIMMIREKEDSNDVFNSMKLNKRFIFNYFEFEIFNKLSFELQDFLLRTSIFNDFDCFLCGEVIQANGAEKLLKSLEQKNLFISCLDARTKFYRYHNLFAEFLQGKLKEMHPGAANNLFMKASNWYEAKNQYCEAIEYSLKAENLANTIKLLEKFGETVLDKGEFYRLVSWVQKLPIRLVNESKVFLYYLIALSSLGKFDGSESFIKFMGFDSSNKYFSGIRGELAVIRASSALNKGDFESVLHWGSSALDILTKSNWLRGLACCYVAYAHILSLNMEKACIYLQEAKSIGIELRNRRLLITSAYYMAFIELLNMRLNKAIGICIETLAILDCEERITLPLANSLYLGISSAYYEINNIKQAEVNVDISIELSEMRKDYSCLMQGYIMKAKILLSKNMNMDALEYIKNIDKLCSTFELRFSLLPRLGELIRVLLSLNELDFAIYFYETCSAYAKDEVRYFERISKIEILIAKRLFKEALCILDCISAHPSREARKINSFLASIYRAVIFSKIGNKTAALSNLEESLKIMGDERWIRTYIDCGETMYLLLREFIEAKNFRRTKDFLTVETATSILLSFNKYSTNGVNSNRFNGEALSNREFEVMQLVVEGLSNSEIAEKLYISLVTVKKHLRSVFRKLGVKNRVQAILILKTDAVVTEVLKVQ